jgi:hypothetical protein
LFAVRDVRISTNPRVPSSKGSTSKTPIGPEWWS